MNVKKSVITLVSVVIVSVGFLDLSGDGLRVYQEVLYGTNPFVEDTNGDGFPDVKNFAYGTNPLKEDTSENGLSDSKAVELGLDPTVYDSSGDGLPDGFVYYEDGLELERYNVVVEYATSESVSVDDDVVVIEEYLDSAVISSEFGVDGVNAVFVETREYPRSEGSFEEYESEWYDELKTLDGYGVHHLLVVDETPDDVDYLGKTSPHFDGLFVREDSIAASEHTSILHELGHQMGLWSEEFAGIDSREYSVDEYPSVMNYNNSCIGGCELLGFAAVDYTIIEENYAENQADTSELDARLDGHTTYDELQESGTALELDSYLDEE